MATSGNDKYQITSAQGVVERLSEILTDINLRLVQAEGRYDATDRAAQEVANQGLRYLESVIVPAATKVAELLRSLGDLFQTTSTTQVTIQGDPVTFVVAQQDRNTFATLGYVIADSVTSDSGFGGPVVSFNQDTGELVIDPDYTWGSGTYSSWILSGSPPVGSIVAATAPLIQQRVTELGNNVYVPRAGGILGSNGQNFAFQDTLRSAVKDRAGDGSSIQVRAATADGLSAAAMTFHRPGAFATWFGLDTDNEFVRGGWSDGPNRFKFWTETNSMPNMSPRGDIGQSFTNGQKQQIKRNAGVRGVGYYGVVSQTSTLTDDCIGKVVYLAGSGFTTSLPKLNIGDSVAFYNNAAVKQIIAIPQGGNIYFDGTYATTYVLPPYGRVVFECFSSDGSIFAFDAPPIASTPSVDVDQTFTQAQKARARKNIGAGANITGISASATIAPGSLNGPFYVASGGIIITLPSVAAAVSGDWVDIVNIANASFTVQRSASDTANGAIYYAGVNTPTITVGPGQSLKLTTDGSNWIAGNRALTPETAAALDGAAFTGGISAPSLSLAGRPIPYPNAAGTSGGNQADINTAQENRLSYGFTATGVALIATASCHISNNSQSAADVYYTLRLIDQTAGNAGVQDKGAVRFAAPVAGSTGGVEITLIQSALTIGHYYTVNLFISKGQAVGPMYPNGMVIQILNF